MISHRWLILTFLLIANSTFANLNRIVLEPRHLTLISSEVTSTVQSVDKKMGQTFSTGELILSLDNQLFEANYKKAIANQARAKAVLDAQKRLFKDKAASFTELKLAEAEFASAEAELVYAKKALDACTIKGPYEGKVQELFVEVHERVEAGQKLVEILDDRVLTAKFLISSMFLEKFKVGQEIDLYIKEAKKIYPATITHIAAAINPASSLVEVDADIDNSSGELKAGMTGNLHIGDDQ
ncbi:MAG: efflux RND transporter periplasmic adaptor subunit [Chlamydiota bacterium]